LKKSINNSETGILSDIKIFMDENKYLFKWDDEKIFRKEFEVLDKLSNILENRTVPKRDYWKDN
jgi:hypothetical protein